MKYIRTKDGIYKTRQCYPEETLFENVTYVYRHEFVKNKDIIAKANTIEELCDEFVFIDEFFKREHRLAFSLENALARCKYHDVDIKTLRGAIWTDEGLIYVAKMNKKGELELL